MFAVERLGSYIKGGIGKVSRPLQPFGGAVDIIVVEQPDGTFKSCPWYVRFGKSQGALKPVEKVISINVNDVDADFFMYLDNNGDAYFLREVDVEDRQAQFYPSAYGDEKVLSPRVRRMQKSKSCDYDVNRAEFVSEFEATNGNMLARGTSCRSVFSLPFGRRSMKEGDSQKGDGYFRATTSLERAEMAADLLEVRWTTNLRTGEKWNANPPRVPKPKLPVAGVVAGVVVSKGCLEDAPIMKNPLMNAHDDCKLDSSLSYETNEASNKESNVEISCSVNPRKNEDICTLAETCVGVVLASDIVDNYTMDKDRNAQSDFPKVSCPLEFEQKEGCCSRNVQGAGLTESGSVTNSEDPSLSCATKENTILQLVEHSGHSHETINTVLKGEMDMKDDQNPYNTALPKLVADTEEDNGYEETSDNVIESENSDEEQFSFSDLDDCKINKVALVGVSPPDDGKECLPQNFLDRSEELTSRDDAVVICPGIKIESKGVSSPISIRKNHRDAEIEFITPVTESLPSMHLVGNNLDELGEAQPLSRSLDSNFEATKIVSDDDQDYLESGVRSSPNSSEISQEIKSIVSDPAIEVSLCRHLLYEGMGYQAAALVFHDGKLDKNKFASLGPNIVKNDRLVVRIGGLYFSWDKALPIASAIGSQGREQILEAKGMIAVGQTDKNGQENPQKNMNSRKRSWKLWPFSYKRTSSVKSLASESAPGNPIGKDRNIGKDENVGNDGGRKEYFDAQKDGSTKKNRNTGEGDINKDACTEKDGSTKKRGVSDGRKLTKKKIRAKIPSSEQLASLNLKEGKNIVTFSFTTTTLGKQQVDARIFFWKWDTRIVISDVDGTITKSDVLGHVMPLMGMDWSQTGVTHLFSAIKENGYQLLFLSARSILQASRTRQFLINLKQDGEVLPEGPIVISPDGLFPSLYREVIRRAPHEFKISCLEAIKALFPRDHNPFYAGFGNRDTDELSYMKVGIPKGKIFTINPKGEVAVNRRVDTKSYTSLHTLVHDMFPPTLRIEQEDYNTWNFWRLPHPEL